MMRAVKWRDGRVARSREDLRERGGGGWLDLEGTKERVSGLINTRV